MAEQIFLSPAVFTQENDLSYLPQGIAQIGAAAVGPTPKGEAFVPTVVTSYQDYVQKFGYSDGNSYMPFVVRNYLKNASSMNVTRILGLDGYKQTKAAVLVSSSSLGIRAIGVFHHSTHTQPTDGAFTDSSLNGVNTFLPFSTTGSLILSGSGTGVNQTFTISPRYIDPNYFGKVLGRSPNTSQDGYLYMSFDKYNTAVTTGSLQVIATDDIQFSGSAYSPASTPWITSQKVGGVATNLFKLNTISHGEYMNTSIKISIANVKKATEVPGSSYGSFTVLVRDITDTDRSMKVLEQFTNCNLDPASSNYICRIIGDKVATYTDGKLIYAGDYKNNSKYITVEVASDVSSSSISVNLVPWGFRAIYEPMLVTGVNFPTASIVHSQEYNSNYNDKIYFGYSFDFINTDNYEYLKPITSNATVGLNIDFNLDNETMHASASGFNGNSFLTDSTPTSARKFSIPLQGGFSGMDPSKPKCMGANIVTGNAMGFDFTSTSTEGYRAYDRALTLLSNQDQYDISVLFTPGLIYSQHSTMIERGIDMVETRGDVFYPFDGSPLETSSTLTAVNNVNDIDSNYSATYFPWVKEFDQDLNKYTWIPASAAISEAISYNDKVGFEWFAPAGLNRGGLTNASDVYFITKQSDRDVLYEGRVNPIAFFPAEGVVVWGQKTLQGRPSALDRVNVRRLLIRLKKYFASVSRYLIFEQNTSKTWTRFLNITNPYMETVKQNQGLYIFKIVMDASNNTPDIIDRNILKGQIWIQPTKTAEFISLEFNITPTGGAFNF